MYAHRSKKKNSTQQNSLSIYRNTSGYGLFRVACISGTTCRRYFVRLASHPTNLVPPWLFLFLLARSNPLVQLLNARSSLCICSLEKKQETDDGQPVVGAFRPQDLALLLLQRRHATDRLAPAAQLRHHSAGQITGKEMHEEKKFCFFFVLFFSDFQFNRVLQHAKPLGLIMPSFTFPSSSSSLSCAFYRSAWIPSIFARSTFLCAKRLAVRVSIV